MPKFFVTSDIHSFYTPFKKALDEKGFDPNNEDHWLVVCGDCFDRGDESLKLFRFLMSLERKILVKGNHDILLEDCCMREYPEWHDVSNGTTKTIEDIGDAGDGRSFDECCQITWHKLARYRELLVDYFETQNYIFVHSWVPTNVAYDKRASKPWHQIGKTYSYKEDWRNATDSEWEEAMWGNPFEMADIGLNKTGKTVVFGHFHTSYAHSKDDVASEFGEDANFDIYYGKDYIGLDACIVYTGKVNILVLEDEFINE
jgi:serine/threonine protein phosphatase 1